MNWPRYLGPVVKTRLAKAVQDETGQPRVLIQLIAARLGTYDLVVNGLKMTLENGYLGIKMHT